MPADDFCDTCKMPLDTLVRDEVRLSHYQVLVRCQRCSHIVIYRSSGKPFPGALEEARAVVGHPLSPKEGLR